MIRKQLIPIALITCMITSYLPLSTALADTSTDAVSIKSESVNAEAAADNSMGSASIDIPAVGEITVTGKSSIEPTQEDLERIITAVKAKITIPSEYSQFEYYFSAESSYSSSVWNLNWTNKDNTKQINIQSDQKANILYYNAYSNNGEYYAPKYLKTELEATADKFIKKTSSDIYGSIKYIKVESQGLYSNQYVYQYQRVENGIPMKDNIISVGVNYATGKVVYYSASWLYDVEIPSADAVITKKEAEGKIGKKVTMQLSYQNAYTTDDNGDTTIKAFLVYAPDQAYAAVDAKTGEVYTTQNEWIDMNDRTKTDSATQEESAQDAGGLTEEEITKVEELANLISRENAIKAVTDNKNLLRDKSLKSISAKLYKQNNYDSVGEDTKYVWNINLSDPREVDYSSDDTYRANASATVDAQTGKLISYYSSVKDYYNMNKSEWDSVKVNYNSDQGKKILEDFLKTQIPDYFKNSVFAANTDSYIIAFKDDKEVYGGYSYQYERVNEDINYSYNGIHGAVDGVTGKIYSFSYNWNDKVTFESPKNIINADKAFDYYISNDGFALAYEINNIHKYDDSYSAKEAEVNSNAYSLENEIRLVYRTDISPTYISPFTGKQLNYGGEEYDANENNYSYADIKGHDSARNILLLADIGIGFSGGKFIPQQAITTKELGEFLSIVNYNYHEDKYKLKNDSSPITRLDASKHIIRILGYENIAKINGIYSTDFKDQDQISEADLGYVALAHGLKLINSDSNNEFKPALQLSRGEAADMLIAMLSAKE